MTRPLRPFSQIFLPVTVRNLETNKTVPSLRLTRALIGFLGTIRWPAVTWDLPALYTCETAKYGLVDQASRATCRCRPQYVGRPGAWENRAVAKAPEHDRQLLGFPEAELHMNMSLHGPDCTRGREELCDRSHSFAKLGSTRGLPTVRFSQGVNL
jgi:hypothetical protein